MVEISISVFAFLFITALAFFAIRAIRAQSNVAIDVLRESLQITRGRLQDVENRLLSHNWVEYSNLSTITSPTERAEGISDQYEQLGIQSVADYLQQTEVQEEAFEGPTFG